MHNHDTELEPVYINLKSNFYTTKYGDSHYLFELEKNINARQNVDMILSVDSLKFTNSFYIINENDNKFYYMLEDDSYITLYTLNIPNGNYSAESLCAFLTSNTPFTVSFNETNFKITITHASLEFILINNSNNILNVLGFNNNLSSLSYTAISDNLINLTGSQMLYVEISNINTNSILTRGDTTSSSIVLATPITSHSGDIQVIHGTHTHKLKNQTINNLEVRLINEEGLRFNFNNIPWYLNLSINFSYKKNKILPTYLLDNLEETTINDDKLSKESNKK